MLQLDPNNRPTLAQVMSNPWLAPHLYRLATTLGALPCTSKVTRPLSRPNSFKRAESFRLRYESFMRDPLMYTGPKNFKLGASPKFDFL